MSLEHATRFVHRIQEDGDLRREIMSKNNTERTAYVRNVMGLDFTMDELEEARSLALPATTAEVEAQCGCHGWTGCCTFCTGDISCPADFDCRRLGPK